MVAPVLRQTYVVPVYRDGFLYGMSGRMTLTCVDAATGAQRWRSRRARRRLPAAGGRRPRGAHQGKHAPRRPREPGRLEGRRPHRPVRRRRLVAAGLRGRRFLRARPEGDRARRVAGARRGRERFGPGADLAEIRSLPGRARHGERQADGGRRFPGRAGAGSARRVAGPGRLPVSRSGQRRRARGRHERRPPRGPDVARRRDRSLLVRVDARATRASTTTSCATSRSGCPTRATPGACRGTRAARSGPSRKSSRRWRCRAGADRATWARSRPRGAAASSSTRSRARRVREPRSPWRSTSRPATTRAAIGCPWRS